VRAFAAQLLVIAHGCSPRAILALRDGSVDRGGRAVQETGLMRINQLAVIALLGCGLCVHALAAPLTSTITFDAETVGAAASAFEAIVGDWRVGEADGKRGLLLDGTRWRQGTPSANLADQAKRLYGDRYAEFLDGVKAFAFFPLAIYQGECAGDRTLRVRFYPLEGKIDQAAGIAFDIADNGSYYGVRANALEDNLLFFKVSRGKRTILQTVRGVDTATRSWHTLSAAIRSKQLTVELDGKRVLERALERLPTGRCGLWSKADSKVLFDDFEASR
jgi:hypothetical protein